MNNNIQAHPPISTISDNPIWTDLTRATTSTISSTVATTPLFNIQNSIIKDKKIRWNLRSLYIGNISNLLAFTGNLGLGNLSQGYFTRTARQLEIYNRWTEEAAVPLTSGAVGACGALTGEIFMVVAKKTDWSFSKIIKEIVKQRKPSMVYIGATPTILRDSIAIGSALGPAPKIKNHLINQYNFDNSTAIAASSVFTGIISSVITQPLQVIRVTVQYSAIKKNNETPNTYKLCPNQRLTATKAISKLWKAYGWKSMFRGLIPRSLIVIVITGCQGITDEFFPSHERHD